MVSSAEILGVIQYLTTLNTIVSEKYFELLINLKYLIKLFKSKY